MHFTLQQKQTDDPHDTLVIASDFVRVAPADEELSSVLQDAARHLSDAQTRTGSGVAAGAVAVGPSVPPVDTTVRPVAINDVRVPRKRWSMGRAAVRGFTALLLAVCIGGAAVAWQSHGDAAKQMIAAWAPPFLISSLPLEKLGLPAQPAAPAVQADVANAEPSQPAPQAQSAAEAVAPATAAAPSSESAQLQSMARDLAAAGQEIEQLKASIEQLKASQQQISRDVAKVSEAKTSETRPPETRAPEVRASEVRASEQNLRPRRPAPPPRSAAAPARRPLQPFPPPQTTAARTLPQAAAPYPPLQPEPQSQTAAEPQADPELASVPRPPMPLR
jgi:hypothetical protein